MEMRSSQFRHAIDRMPGSAPLSDKTEAVSNTGGKFRPPMPVWPSVEIQLVVATLCQTAAIITSCQGIFNSPFFKEPKDKTHMLQLAVKSSGDATFEVTHSALISVFSDPVPTKKVHAWVRTNIPLSRDLNYAANTGPEHVNPVPEVARERNKLLKLWKQPTNTRSCYGKS